MKLKENSTRQLESFKKLETTLNNTSSLLIIAALISFTSVLIFTENNIENFKFVLILIFISFFVSVVSNVYSKFFSKVQVEIDKKRSTFADEYGDIKELLKKHSPNVKEVSENLQRDGKIVGELYFKQIILIDNFIKELDELDLSLKSTIELKDRIQSVNFFYMTCLEDSKGTLLQKVLLKLKEKNLRKLLMTFEETYN